MHPRLVPAALCLLAANAFAVSLDDLSNADASSGLRVALEKGAVAAVGKLGRENGFLNNEKVHIPLPRILEKARPLLEMSGRGEQLNELETAMNRAAESAVPMAKPLLIDAIKSLTVTDAKNILSGGETSVTDFFRERTSSKLSVQFLPLVKRVTDRSSLSAKFNGAIGQVNKFGVGKGPASVEDYVTERAIEGLYVMIAEEEKAIRRDPIGTGSKILRKVFGAL
ncbi:DUF4197 domain-containing protein [Massilia sp. H-1]|nr:DUF4197 domain-containing protein [Massilia sp. H-1]